MKGFIIANLKQIIKCNTNFQLVLLSTKNNLSQYIKNIIVHGGYFFMWNLSQVPLNEEVTLFNINMNESEKRRLLLLGFIDGTKIKAVHKGPCGDPIAYELRNTIVALRSEDAKKILVLREGNYYE